MSLATSTGHDLVFRTRMTRMHANSYMVIEYDFMMGLAASNITKSRSMAICRRVRGRIQGLNPKLEGQS